MKKINLVLVQILISVFILESVSNYYLKNSKNALYRTRRILQKDISLGWRQQSNLNTRFENAKLVTDNFGFRIAEAEKPEINYSSGVLMLGPSSAFGWGVQANETYSFLLAKALHLNLLNASQIGYSIRQGSILWNQYLKNNITKTQIALIAFGVNDLDKFRFYTSNYTSDEKYFSEKINISFLERNELYSRFLSILSLAIEEYSKKIDCSILNNIEQRVSIEQYFFHLERLISDLKSKNVKVVLMNTPILLDSKVTYNANQIDSEYQAVNAASSSHKCEQALMHLNRAKSLEPERIKEDILKLNTQMVQFSEKNNIKLIDVNLILNTNKAQENFFDPIHPSARGHNLIAQALILHLK